MLRGAGGRQQRQVARFCHLLVFSVGGKKLAAKTTEVGGIAAWTGSLPVPSQTKHVSSVVRQDRGVVPVYNLAELLQVTVQGEQTLCLLAKQPGGSMAICIDDSMPSLHLQDMAMIRPHQEGAFPAAGQVTIGMDDVPIISLARLGYA